MNFNKVMKEHAIQEAYNFFQEVNEKLNSNKGIEYFLGGSERFGYNLLSSDIDFFVYVSKDVSSDFEDYLMSNGFIRDRSSSEFYNAEELYYHPQYKLHIAVMMNKVKFDYLRNDHDGLYSYLEENPIVVKFIQNFKLNLRCNKKEDKGMGKYIFQSLCSTFGFGIE